MQKDGTEGLFLVYEKVQNKLKNKLFFPIMKRNKMDKNGKTFLVTYMAVRDGEGNYLGTMELVQDMEFAKEYFTK